MEKVLDKQDLSKFFNSIKSKYDIPGPQNRIFGKVTCRNGTEYIEKPYINNNDIEEIRQESRLTRQKHYEICGHNSSVTSPYRTLGNITLDSKKLTLNQFKANLESEKGLAMNHMAKWRNATKVVLPVIRLNAAEHHRRSFDPSLSDEKLNISNAAPSVHRIRRKQFVVYTKEWPKIHSTGYTQIAAAVNKTNKRVSATKGTKSYFKVLECAENEDNLDNGGDCDVLEDTSISQPPALDSIRRETIISRLEAFVFVVNGLLNIKNKDLKNKYAIRPESVQYIAEDKQQASCKPNIPNIPELPPIKGFSWNEGIPPWQKIKQENEFLASVDSENTDKEHELRSEEAKYQELLLNLRKDFTALQEKLDFHVHCRLKRLFRDDKAKFVRRFHALKHAPTLSLGVTELRRVDRTNTHIDHENKKTSSKQDWYNEALEDLEIKRYGNDEKVVSLLDQFERFSHTDIADEIKALKAKLCYLTLSMPVYYILQPDYQYVMRFIIQKCLAVQEDFFGIWFKMRFRKGRLTCN